ncbi:hypothetical protein [[Pseudopropionibacterium] massiliense]|uniref:hypothetical protein n=1 Tax=[Pseudopropionibacterium] massiliense TaxID=2220000 RepID=UPI001031F5A4|nr:hypothetical protein [[Pseudopropionibacterium] massiliense]
MNLRRVITTAMVVLLAGCASTSDPEPSQTPSVATSASATPEASASSSPTVAFPVPMSITQDLATGGAKQVVRRMMEITNNRPALKLDVSSSEVTLTVLDATQKPFTLRWRANQITPADSDIQYLGQATFRPTDYPLGNISELFDTATRMGATGTEKILQIVEQRSGEVYLTVTTTPETKTVFFEKDGTAVRNLGYTSVADLTDGLAAVIGGSRAATRIGFGANTGYWIDLPANNGITERRIRSAALPVYTTRIKEASSLVPFDPIQLKPLVLARSIQKFNPGLRAECRIEVDNRYRRTTPIIRYDCGGKVHFTDPDGTEYTEDQLKQ